MRNLFVLLIVFVLFSCTKEAKVTTPSIPVSDRLVFKNFEEYNDTYLTLAKIKSTDDLKFWAQGKMHSTLLNSADSSLVDYSDVLKTILNKDSEFQIGDSIVLFDQGNLYAYSKNESDKISLKNNPEKFNKIGFVKVTIVDHGATEKSTPLGLNSLDARWQSEFTLYSWHPCGGATTNGQVCRKFVNEIVDESTYAYYVYYSHLYLRVKLEYKTCGNHPWHPASEAREVHVHITGSAYWYPGGFGAGCGQNADFSCSLPLGPAIGAIYLPLMSANGAAIYPPYWTVILNGSISQQVIGDSFIWPVSGTKPDGYLW